MDANNKTRCFISLPLPATVINEIVTIQNFLKGKHLFKGKYTAPKNAHLTLKFLGEIDQELIHRVNKALESIEFSPIEVQLGDIGVFSRRHVRVIWLHLKGVNTLQSIIDETLESFFEPEVRFMSHITIARVKSLPDKEALLNTLDYLECQPLNETISTFQLKKSTLTPQGPIYETIKTYSL